MAFKISNHIPVDLLKEIKDHLRSQGNSAHCDYPDNQADEDCITGALGSALRRGWSSRTTDDTSWRWRVQSKKFVGRGNRAQETAIGADAIIEFVLERPDGQAITKGLLFQAKKDGSQQGLQSQVKAMERLAQGCSAVIDYSAGGYRAIAGANYLNPRQGLKRELAHRDGQQLGDYLADEFVECRAGIAGMSYDPFGRELKIPSDRFGLRSVPSDVRERIRITAVGPIRFPD